MQRGKKTVRSLCYTQAVSDLHHFCPAWQPVCVVERFVLTEIKENYYYYRSFRRDESFDFLHRCWLPNFVIWWPLFNSQATLLIWSAHIVSLVRWGRPHRSFCQFRRTTWTLLFVVSLLLLQDSGTLFLWTVELVHLLTHLRPGLRHFSLFRHNPHCSTRLCTMARYNCIDWLIDWLIA